jgi:hypothetical protein
MLGHDGRVHSVVLRETMRAVIGVARARKAISQRRLAKRKLDTIIVPAGHVR